MSKKIEPDYEGAAEEITRLLHIIQSCDTLEEAEELLKTHPQFSDEAMDERVRQRKLKR